MKVGDLVRIKPENDVLITLTWPESIGQIGVIVEEVRRLYIPAAKVLVLGEVAEFDIDELELISESR
tara:strand:+ start:514 stop:714 length:201 start_codon:yes stop_codon:yes gene_type:complete